VIRSLALSAWIVGVTLAAAYFGATVSFHSAPAKGPAEEGPMQMTLKSMSVPVIANGVMQGYVLAQVTLTLKRDLLKTLPQPPEFPIADSVFKVLYAEEQVDFKHLKKQDLDKVSNAILESVNARAAGPLVENVYIQELHYLSKQEAGAGLATGAGPAAGAAPPQH
jgi:hypothetical protein